MKKHMNWILAGGTAFALVTSSQAINITIPDGVGGNEYDNVLGTDAAGEDEEVEPRASTAPGWDLEAFIFDETELKLSIQGEYDFINGRGNFQPGDIFIDMNGDAKYGRDLDGTQSGKADVTDNWGYEYVVAFNYDTDETLLNNGYTIYDIRNRDTTTITVFYGVMAFSNPWRYADGGIEVTTGTFDYSVVADVDTPYALHASGGTQHNLLSNINLSDILSDASTPFLAHNTMECGNDLVIGQNGTFRVSDGGPLVVLLGIALSGIGILRRKL